MSKQEIINQRLMRGVQTQALAARHRQQNAPVQLKEVEEPEPYAEPLEAPEISMTEMQASSRDLPDMSEPAPDFFTPMFQESPIQAPKQSERSTTPIPVSSPPAPQPLIKEVAAPSPLPAEHVVYANISSSTSMPL